VGASIQLKVRLAHPHSGFGRNTLKCQNSTARHLAKLPCYQNYMKAVWKILFVRNSIGKAEQRHGKIRCRVCRSHWGYVDTNLLNVVNKNQATKKYQFIQPKTGDVQVALQAGRPT
jgi:hypothetical protein